MREIRTLVVDDEPPARRGIRQLLEAHPDFVVVGECRDGHEALRSLALLKPDLVFLDVQMPGLSGLQLVRLYGAERMPVVVFVTAHDAFAVRAFEASALDYLVKPLSAERFAAAVTRVRERIMLHDEAASAGRLRRLLDDQPASQPGGRLSISTESGTVLLDFDEIDWIEADDYRVAIHAGSRCYRVRAALGALELTLPGTSFMRLHRSVIVHLPRVRAFRWATRTDDATVVLTDGTVLPVSRRRAAAVREAVRRLLHRGDR